MLGSINEQVISKEYTANLNASLIPMVKESKLYLNLQDEDKFKFIKDKIGISYKTLMQQQDANYIVVNSAHENFQEGGGVCHDIYADAQIAVTCKDAEFTPTAKALSKKTVNGLRSVIHVVEDKINSRCFFTVHANGPQTYRKADVNHLEEKLLHCFGSLINTVDIMMDEKDPNSKVVIVTPLFSIGLYLKDSSIPLFPGHTKKDTIRDMLMIYQLQLFNAVAKAIEKRHKSRNVTVQFVIPTIDYPIFQRLTLLAKISREQYKEKIEKEKHDNAGTKSSDPTKSSKTNKSHETSEKKHDYVTQDKDDDEDLIKKGSDKILDTAQNSGKNVSSRSNLFTMLNLIIGSVLVIISISIVMFIRLRSSNSPTKNNNHKKIKQY